MRFPSRLGVLAIGMLLLSPAGIAGARDAADAGARDAADAGGRGAAAAAADAPDRDDTPAHDEVADLLQRAVAAAGDVAHAGRLLVASFGEGGPQLTELELTRGLDGGVSVRGGTGWEVGRVGDEGFLRSSGSLLRLGGIERATVDLGRLHRKYLVVRDEDAVLDTGRVRVLRVHDRRTGVVRERLHLDADTDLIVRRETFAPDGRPLRVVAFTALEVAETRVAVPEPDGLQVESFSLHPYDAARFADAGFEVPTTLPAGYELLGGFERPEARVPTLHLVYGDGLYTLSVFQQLGTLSLAGVEGATMLRADDGGAVWRWPGSEPRRVVWRGDGATFTAITDAPVDELLTVVTGLPNDPAPSILGRLARGIARVGRWVWPLDGSPL